MEIDNYDIVIKTTRFYRQVCGLEYLTFFDGCFLLDLVSDAII